MMKPFTSPSVDWLRSEPFILRRLKDAYRDIPEKERLICAYRRAPQARHWFEQSQTLYAESKNVGWYAKPTLLYYAAYALMRLWLLFTRADYPKRQEELAHGLAVKKLKPKRFVLCDDTIRVKHEGTFPLYSASRYQYKSAGENWKVAELLEFIQKHERSDRKVALKTGIPVLLPHLIFLYYTSHLSRYDSERWMQVLSQEEESSLYVYIFFERLIPGVFHDLLTPFYRASDR
ncbi:MAG: hypothetical protein IMX04_07525 [Candidatus Carbobacillus altaicus]|nr:hypothetical protein [Candidatus Carbobacillus altaicus]